MQSLMSTDSFRLELADDGVAILTLDVPGESTNTLRASFAAELEQVLASVRGNAAIKALVLASGKPDNFVVGADINMLKAVSTAGQAAELSRAGHRALAGLQALNLPLVAAIHGPALGGGLELALACHERVCSDDVKTVLGLPEVQLGVLPGSGGTQRLPKLVGIAAALDMMLTGKHIRAKQALKMGLVDEVVPRAHLLKAARQRALKLVPYAGRERLLNQPHKTPSLLSAAGLMRVLLEGNPLGRSLLFSQARKQVARKTGGHYPAPDKIIDCVAASGARSGYETEARHFGELVVTPVARECMNIFFATTGLKKDRFVADDVRARELRHVGVLGGGLMGAGIALVTLDKAGLPVRVKDRDERGTGHAVKYVYDAIMPRVAKRYLSAAEAGKKLALLTTATDYSGFRNVDLVIEAVFEDLALKQQMVRDIEASAHANTIFATNTSSIPISDIAAAASRPENVIGLHYFSPVDKMPLLEIIVTDQTSAETIATSVQFGRAQGKTVIVVKDKAGFYVNRILAPYMNEAGQLLASGVAIDKIDRALKTFGFPLGPIQLLDEVGIDVGTKVAPILARAFGDRMLPPAVFSRLLEDKRLGKKNGRGFYRYDDAAKGKREVDSSVYTLLGVTPTRDMPAQDIAERCLLMMVNEAVRCLEDGIIRSPRDGDIGAIFGIGFPPFLGGPFRYIDNRGAAAVVEQLERYARDAGERFAPAALLREHASSGRKFYS